MNTTLNISSQVHFDLTTYTDQMQMYVHNQTKEESLSKEWAYKHAERIYKPNE